MLAPTLSPRLEFRYLPEKKKKRRNYKFMKMSFSKSKPKKAQPTASSKIHAPGILTNTKFCFSPAGLNLRWLSARASNQTQNNFPRITLNKPPQNTNTTPIKAKQHKVQNWILILVMLMFLPQINE